MSTKKTDLSKLSHGDLDGLILYGIQQQESVVRHGSHYQHLLNVVAKAKQEKAKRVEDGDFDYSATDGLNHKEIADGLADDLVEELPLSTANPVELKVAKDAPKGTEAKIKATKKPIAPKPTVDDGSQIPAEKINQGLPGVTADAAKETPENKKQG